MTGAAKHLVSCRTQDLLDDFLVRVLFLLVCGRGAKIAPVIESFAPRYAQAMADGLWKEDPYAFLHVRLLAALQVGEELGLLHVQALPDVIPYVPLWFISPA